MALLWIALLIAVALPAAANARLSGSALTHAKSAELFASRHDWNNALLHARQVGDPVFTKLVLWQYLQAPDSQAGFDDISQFLRANPNWPEQKKLHIRAELALRDAPVADSAIIQWFRDDLPLTGIGKVAFAQALQRSGNAPPEKINYLLRDAWRNGDFDDIQENQLLATYGNLFKREDDIMRMDRLLWEGKLLPAQRLLKRLPEDYQRLANARMGLMEDRKNAAALVASVPALLRNDPGLLYDRMRYRARAGDTPGVRELLLSAPAVVPYPAKWWRTREVQIREAIDEGNFSVAKKLIANHGQVDGQELADAAWLQGWLQLELSRKPAEAYATFAAMYEAVHMPVSKARAAYWAAMAAAAAGDKEASARWFDNASAYPTTFYGQLGALKSQGKAPLHIPTSLTVTVEDKRRFDKNELARAARLCIELDETDLAAHLINHIIETADHNADILQAASLSNGSGYFQLGVKSAKKAMQSGTVVPLASGYPTPKTPPGLAVERPLALAIARQESEFDQRAQSPANALGLMQLLPGTARETAKKFGLGFALKRLFEQQYNLSVGSYYLSRMVTNYNGSYVMAIAAYNAGPGNVRKWALQFGTPGNRVDNAVDWIERIPFAETRNYVQRVMENLEVYRHIESGGQGKLRLEEDLVR